MIMSDWQHHSSDDAVSPIGALKYLNFPWGSRNVVSIELSWSSPSWKYPCTVSSAAKYLASFGTACRISVVCENRCTGRLTCLFSCVLSVTRRTLILSPFGTKNAGLHYSVGSLTLVITLFFISSSIVLAASFSYLRATRLAERVLKG